MEKDKQVVKKSSMRIAYILGGLAFAWYLLSMFTVLSH
jgi:uncharacterized membrane protein YuzA (DUF378 family)